jgi:4-carboxymuconolactone decarboxylase
MKRVIAALGSVMTLLAPFAGHAQDATRFPPLKPEELSPAQKAWADTLAAPPRNDKTPTRHTAPMSAAPNSPRG